MLDDRMARIALACIVEPGTAGIAEEVAESGAAGVLSRAATRAGGRRRTPGWVDPDEIPGLVTRMERMGVRVVVPGDPEFPTQLLDLAEPPLALWVRGPLDLRVSALRSVSVVGARACTAYGERATAAVAGGLAEVGWSVVSGAAFGIDAAAHRAALAVAGPTIAVLACGIDQAYPRAHDSLLCRIGDTGAVITELPPGSLPLKHRFLARNRLIAALSRGTVVVEAARRSGAIATANRALELGRVLMAVPGPITSIASSGTNQLLHEQSARAVSSADEVTGLLLAGSPGEASGSAGPGVLPGHQASVAGSGGAGPEEVGLPEGALAVLAILPRRAGPSVEVLAERAGVSPPMCLAHLGLLEVAGLARRVPAGWRRSA
jgi:DNA processing protein